MDSELEYCINQLADVVEENDDGASTYSGSEAVRLHRSLSPILLEELALDPDNLRINAGRVESELSNLLLEAKHEANPAQYVETHLGEFKDDLYAKSLEKYVITFPLNFDRMKRDLIPDSIRVADVTFQRLRRGEWKDRFLPNSDADKPYYASENKLAQFLKRSPNDIDNHRFTYWFVEYNARDNLYAVNRVIDRLEILLGMLNFSSEFGKEQTYSSSQGPWPDRWASLRQPFVYLLHSDDGYQTHYWSDDPSLQKPDKPHSSNGEVFETVFDSLPTFENEQPLDGRLLNAFRAFQSAITEPEERESFFEFWRGVEILTLVERDEAMPNVVNRASALIEWDDPEIGRIRTDRCLNKRNAYVHEGAGLRVTVPDRNLVKTLLESLMNFYLERRTVWSVEDMRFVLDNFTASNAVVEHLRQQREKELELIDWIETIADQN
ncbi:hypothetical protein A4G99_19630 [Haladaptatus sp. R4]|uniref:HEPN domain-containing protein n=1 Tax=Haladaptatus sp. R4 TaxID=1679489 RepID=UPI0007B47343|nr:HEPN domain-containing protein [Haladaptatus sp. R4]KZN22663.1 hypothetical protein A4G99_19630 [Haladaptatus sp. R4]